MNISSFFNPYHVIIKNECYFILETPLTITQGAQVLSIPVLYEEYQIDFKLTVTAKGSVSGLHGIIRLTNTNVDLNQPGDAVPLLQIQKSLKKLKFTTTFNNGTNYKNFFDQVVPKNQQKTIQIKQQVDGAGFSLNVTYDGAVIVHKQFDNNPPIHYNDIKVYVSDTFTPAIPATMEDLVITTCKFAPHSKFLTLYAQTLSWVQIEVDFFSLEILLKIICLDGSFKCR